MLRILLFIYKTVKILIYKNNKWFLRHSTNIIKNIRVYKKWHINCKIDKNKDYKKEKK
jgi:hypothetical protein